MTIYLIAFAVTLAFTVVLTVAGLGAAFILVPIYLALGVEMHSAQATALLLNAIAMAFACARYIPAKLVDFRVAVPIVIVATALSPLGAYTSSFVPVTTLKWLFIGFLVFAGTMMLFYRPTPRELAGRGEILGVGLGVADQHVRARRKLTHRRRAPAERQQRRGEPVRARHVDQRGGAAAAFPAPDFRRLQRLAVQPLAAADRSAAERGEGRREDRDRIGAHTAARAQDRGEFGADMAAQGRIELLEQKAGPTGVGDGLGGRGGGLGGHRAGVAVDRPDVRRSGPLARLQRDHGAQAARGADDRAIRGARQVVGDDGQSGDAERRHHKRAPQPKLLYIVFLRMNPSMPCGPSSPPTPLMR